MKQISQPEFEKILLEVKGATPITFVATTDARANRKSVDGNKTPNPYDKILKRTRVNGFIGYDYEAAVNRQRTREGETADFEVGERSHGERIAPAVAETNGVRKLVVKVQSYLESEYFGVIGTTMKAITKDEAKLFIKEKTSSGAQGVEKEIDHKEYNISNIESVTLKGENYELLKS